MKCMYQYEEKNNYDLLNISIIFDKYKDENQDEIFNEVIAIISKIETKSSLSTSEVEHINKFLSLAKHNKGLDIRKFLTK